MYVYVSKSCCKVLVPCGVESVTLPVSRLVAVRKAWRCMNFWGWPEESRSGVVCYCVQYSTYIYISESRILGSHFLSWFCVLRVARCALVSVHISSEIWPQQRAGVQEACLKLPLTSGGHVDCCLVSILGWKSFACWRCVYSDMRRMLNSRSASPDKSRPSTMNGFDECKMDGDELD